jgi:protein-disulfide isomerase
MDRYWKSFFILVSLIAISVAQEKPAAHTAAPTHATAKPAAEVVLPSEEVVNAFLQQTFGYDPSLSWKVAAIKPSEAAGLAEVDVTISNSQGTQGEKFYVSRDGRHALVGEIWPFGAHPYEAALKELEHGINGPAHGPANAPVTVVEFSDLQCPHCKEAQPNIDRLISEEKDVRVVFQNFPLPMHDWAAKAADYADCVGRSSTDAFLKFIDSVYGAQSDITASNADEKLTGFADAAGAKGSEVASCAATPETTTRIEHSVNLAKTLDVTSTPTIFVNGRKLPGGLPYETLQKMVAFAAKNPQ